MLYELLTGASPYGDDTSTPASLAIAICERQPRPPSAAAKGATQTGPTLPASARSLVGDLDAIVLKALRKEPVSRYGSVGQLAEDVRRLLAGHPVSAREGSRAYRWRKLVRRHRLVIGAGAAVAAALVAAAAVSVGQARAAARERDRALLAEGRARQQASTAAQVVDFLVGLYDKADPERTQGRVPTVVEVLDESRAALRNGGPRDPVVRAALQEALARAYLEMGQGEPARALAGEAVTTLRAARREPAAALLTLGRAQALQGDLPGAETTLRAARRAALAPGVGGDGALVRQTASALATVLTEATRYDEARKLRLGVLEQLARRLGVDPEAPTVPAGRLSEDWGELAVALYDLSDLDLDRGDYATAVETSRRALAVGERVWGAQDSRVAKLQMGLGNALDEVDRAPEAAAILAQGLASYRRVFGAGHVEVGKALVNYGGVLRRVGREAESVAVLEEAVALFDATVGRTHRYTAVALNNLANGYIGVGERERGLSTHREALAVRRKLWPAQHPEVAQSLRNIGNLHFDLGRPHEALPYVEQAAAAYEASLGPAHPNSVDARMAVGGVLCALEDWQRARAILEDAYAKSAGHEDPVMRARIAQFLATALAAQGERTRALELAREAVRLTEKLGLGSEELDLAALRGLVERLGERHAGR
jgi:serine/threonine-protein kinase